MGAPPVGVSRFAAYFRVRHYEMDALGHVNNAVYLHYLEQAAIEHSAAVGYDLARLRALGGVFIARRHEIDYLRPASAGDILQVVTWAVELKGAQAIRDYAIYRYEPPASSRGLPDDALLSADFAPPGPPGGVGSHALGLGGRPERPPAPHAARDDSPVPGVQDL